MLRLLLLCVALFLGGCEFLSSEVIDELEEFDLPTVELTDTLLVDSPTADEVAAYYCPDLMPGPSPETQCALLLSDGDIPKMEELQFHYELVFEVDNPNNFPIFTTEVLTSIDLFEGSETSTLGAVCTQLCDPKNPSCTGIAGPESCQDDVNDIDSLDDLENAVPELLAITADAAINGELDNLLIREIPEGSEKFEIRVRFSLGIEAMLELLSQYSTDLAGDFLDGEDVSLEIPYAITGRLWIEAPLIGRVAFSYGPFKDTWEF